MVRAGPASNAGVNRLRRHVRQRTDKTPAAS